MAITHEADAGIACAAAVLSMVAPNSRLMTDAQGIESESIAKRLLQEGNDRVQAGNLDDAVLSFSLAIQVHPKSAAAAYHRGVTYFYLMRDQDAIADLTQAIQLNPKLAKAFSYRGLVFYGLGQLEAAIVDFNQATLLAPDLVEVYYHRALIYNELDNEIEARHQFELATKVTGANTTVVCPFLHKHLGLEAATFHSADPYEAASLKRNADKLYQHSLIMLRRGNWREAVNKLRAAATCYQCENKLAQYQRAEKLLSMIQAG